MTIVIPAAVPLRRPVERAPAREAVTAFRARDAWRASGAVALDFTLYFGLSAAVVFAPPLVKPVLSVALALVITRLFVLGHDACHGSMFVSRRANEIVGRLLFLPSYSPNLNLIERLWGFAKRQSVYGKYQPNFDSFRTAIEKTLAEIPTTHAKRLESLMTLKFQEFKDVSLLAA